MFYKSNGGSGEIQMVEFPPGGEGKDDPYAFIATT